MLLDNVKFYIEKKPLYLFCVTMIFENESVFIISLPSGRDDQNTPVLFSSVL